AAGTRPTAAAPAPAPVTIYQSTYRLATLLTLPLAASLLVFWAVTRGAPERVADWELIPQAYLLLFFCLLLFPLHRLSRTGRSRLLATLRRIWTGGLAESQDGKFGDIILADVLTSYSRVFGDLYVAACLFLARDASSTRSPPDRVHFGHATVMVPVLVALPSLIRLRQCMVEFWRVYSRGGGTRSIDGWGGQHLANALKYASAFPPIALNALQQQQQQQQHDLASQGAAAGHQLSPQSIYHLWILSSAVNSLYSFYWDVAKDWDLTLFQACFDRAHADEHPFGLRRWRFLHGDYEYYGAIATDLVLRFTWLARVSGRLQSASQAEGGVFVLQLLEVVRRWLWIFFRVETEWVRHTRGPAPDDILLGEFEVPKVGV
ncbi:protein-ER retention protein, partial [Ascosphaera acerosa]